MCVVRKYCGLEDCDFSLVYTQFPPERGNIQTHFVLIIDEIRGDDIDGETILKTTEPPRLPFDIEPVQKFLKPDLQIWRSREP